MKRLLISNYPKLTSEVLVWVISYFLQVVVTCSPGPHQPLLPLDGLLGHSRVGYSKSTL